MMATVLTLGSGAGAEVRLAKVFSDGMVLQRDMPVPVWGWADDGARVTVSIQGRSAEATATGGKWRATLPALEAGGPFELRVESGAGTLVVPDVLVGEVWVCSGQSNMNYPVSKTSDADAALAECADPQLRLLRIEKGAADAPAADLMEAEWRAADAESVGHFSGAAYHFGRSLREALGVPVGLIQASVGGTDAHSWMTRETLASEPDFAYIFENFEKAVEVYPQAMKTYEEKLAQHEEKLKKAKEEGRELTRNQRRKPRAPMGPEHPKRPCAFYYGRISPLQPFAIRGAIWYQAERNSGRPLEYRKMFPMLIQDWRRDWGQGDFPFLFVQLPNFDRGGPEFNWPLTRESQLKTLALPNTGMAVSIDVGEDKNLHPPNKRPVGERLALAARAIAYGEDIVYSGPIFDRAEFRDGKAILSFRHVGGGLAAKGDALAGFVIAGEDKVFHSAQAKIEGDRIVVSSSDVAAPVAVRYSWHRTPDGNLVNKEGLPASPFRTDEFEFEGAN